MRRSDTPLLITRMQEEMLSYLAKADDALGFYREIPNALKVLREYSRKVFAGECRIEDMIFTAAYPQPPGLQAVKQQYGGDEAVPKSWYYDPARAEHQVRYY